MKILVVGGVAAGTKAAAKLKREAPDAEVTLITKGAQISYAGCGLPYYVGGSIENEASLFVKTPQEFSALTGVIVRTKTEAVALNRPEKAVTVRTVTGAEEKLAYDKLVLATGAEPFVPNIPGIGLKNVHTLRTPDDAIAIRRAVDAQTVKRAAVIGGGFIGLEIAENLAALDIKTTIIEMAPQILPGFDPEMASIGENHLLRRNVMVLCGERLTGIEGDEQATKITTDKRKLKADLVILSVGVKPNNQLAKESGLTLGPRGAIAVSPAMQTSDPDIYAVGDCAAVRHAVTGKADWIPLGSTANKAGRVAALNIAGQEDVLPGVLGTAIVKLFDLHAARTGLTEEGARAAGYDAVSVIVPANDRAHYYPDVKELTTKLIADRASRRILGAQVIGGRAVDKAIDIAVTAITFGAKVEDLERLDLAYAPPFSTAMGPTIVAANVLRNKLEGRLKTIVPYEFWRDKEQYIIVDVRPAPAYAANHLDGAVSLPVETITAETAAAILSSGKPAVLICKIGKNSYLAYNRLRALGYTNCRVLEGGLAIAPQDIAE